MARVELRGITKRFGKVEALRELDLVVGDGEFVCLLGPSGCGKTTTLRIIGGLETPTHGEVFIGDRMVNRLSAPERDIAMVFQFYALYPYLTIGGNLAFPLRAQKVPRREIEERVNEVAQTLGMEDILNRYPEGVNEAERQRTAIGRAIIRHPQVFLFDEALSNLDSSLRVRMRAEIKNLHTRLKQTMIFVTHDQVEAMAMADRIAVMNEGAIVQYDTPERVFHHPASTFVAGFIGTPPINLVPVTLRQKKGKFLIDMNGKTMDITSIAGPLGTEDRLLDDRMTLGIRPRYVRVSRDKPSTKAYLTAEIDVTEPMGQEILVHAKVSEGFMFRALTSYSAAFKEKERVYMTFDEKEIQLFSEKTGQTVI